MSDEGDDSTEATALRETEEEILVPRDRIEVLGKFHAVPDKTGRIRVTPVVGMLGDVDLATIRFNPDEVAAVFALTLRQLRDPALRGTRPLPSRPGLVSPTFGGGPAQVWGMTAYILDTFMKTVLPVALGAPTLVTERDIATSSSP